MRSAMVSLLSATFLCGAAYAAGEHTPPKIPIPDDVKPDATLELKGGSVAAGIGFSWGHGVLHYQNATRGFAIKGISVLDVGATDYTATGHVYNLKNLGEFAGNYVAASAGLTVAGGGTATYLKNEHGVVIKLISTDVGLKFNLAAEGVHISLKK